MAQAELNLSCESYLHIISRYKQPGISYVKLNRPGCFISRYIRGED